MKSRGVTLRVLRSYTLAILSVTSALVLTLHISPLHDQFKFLLFVFAVAASATGGVRPGVFATLLSMVVADYFLLPPVRSLAVSDPEDLLRMILFLGVGIAISWITDHFQHSDQAIRAAAAVVESSAESIVRQGMDGTILSWNKAAEQIYGYSAEEAIGNSIALVVPPDHKEEMDRLTARVHMGDSVRSHETVRVRKDGTRIDIALTLSPLQDRKGKVVGVSSIAREITERKLAEEALRQSHAKMERQTRQLTLLAEMGEMLQASSVASDAYAVTARYAQTLLPGSSGTLFVHSAAKANLEAVLKWGDQQSNDLDFLAVDQCWGLRTGRLHLVEDCRSGLLCRHLSERSPAWYVCAPMAAQGETLGLLHLWTSRDPRAPADAAAPGSAELTWPVRNMAERLALALADMRLREALRTQSICDPLTGWYNRRHMQDALERDIRRAIRTQHPLSILMLDIDNFKEFNDTFGHEAGDVALQSVCRMIKALIRSEDVACRYGGDEFVLILPDSSAEFAAQRAEEMRLSVSHTALQYQSRSMKPMKLSFGVATYPADGQTAHDMLRAADYALFRAKRGGRDQVRSTEGATETTPQTEPGQA